MAIYTGHIVEINEIKELLIKYNENIINLINETKKIIEFQKRRNQYLEILENEVKSVSNMLSENNIIPVHAESLTESDMEINQMQEPRYKKSKKSESMVVPKKATKRRLSIDGR